MCNIEKFLNEIKVYDVGMTKIRIGNESDGGYIALKELCENTNKVYTLGVGDDVSFEVDFLERFNPEEIVLFDPTIDFLPENRSRFTFYKNDWLDMIPLDIPNNSILKIDIEGAEWEDLELSEYHFTTKMFNQLIIEFHLFHACISNDLSPYFTKIYQIAINEINQYLFGKYRKCLNFLNRYFYIFHIHANNSLPVITINQHSFPPLMEMSFVRKDLVDRDIKDVHEIKPDYPINDLDFPNKTDRPDIYWNPSLLC